METSNLTFRRQSLPKRTSAVPPHQISVSRASPGIRESSHERRMEMDPGHNYIVVLEPANQQQRNLLCLRVSCDVAFTSDYLKGYAVKM